MIEEKLTMEELKLFGMLASPNVFRVALALEEKGIAYTLDEDIGSDEFLKNSRWALMPCLKYGEDYHYESLAIIEWLEEHFTDKPLLPTDLVQKAKARAWMYHMILHLSKNVGGMVFMHDSSANTLADVRKELEGIDEELENRSFLVGDSYTFADLSLSALYPMFDAIKDVINLDEFPNIKKHRDAMVQREGFKRIDISEMVKGFRAKTKDPAFMQELMEGRAKRVMRSKELRRS